ncbi:hypothetical protein SCG7086_CH_00020 [Chlamydiales bacterium SCGC AG-110-P3]|nr:hypothetical protein SCG7086_CH_00020 [Chlamydiales bacterium SCGC AG-110-P3]
MANHPPPAGKEKKLGKQAADVNLAEGYDGFRFLL